MRFAVMADIHGNLPALEAVLEDMQDDAADGVIIAGDLGGGPKPVETVRLIRALQGWVIRGNNEDYFQRYKDGTVPEAWRTSLQWAPLRSVYRRLDEETCDYLFALPEQEVVRCDGALPIRVVHGSPRNPSELLFPDSQPEAFHQALADTAEPVMVCGHTHRPWKQIHNGQLALNPGSVDSPLNGHIGAQYALLTWCQDYWDVELRAISYDMTQIRKAFQESGLLEEGGAFAHAILYTIETGQDVARGFLNYAYSLAAEAGYKNCKTVPDEVWRRAEESFDWSHYS